MAKCTFGTGCFALMNIGHDPLVSDSGLLTTAACDSDGKPTFAIEGSIFIGGAAVQWLRDELEIVENSAEVEELAGQVPDSGGVVLVPAFAGLGAPHWDAHARGGMFGITRGTSKAHLARATLEGIAFQVADVFDAMKAASGIELNELRVDGGACANDLLMQFQADLLGVPVARPKNVETTACGAAFLAGLAVGFWKDESEIEAIREVDHVFEPAMSDDKREALRNRWSKAVERCKGWDNMQV